MAFFSFWKASLISSVHLNDFFFVEVAACSGAQIVAKFLMNLR